MAKAWHLAPALVTLRNEINVAWPKRQKKMDGSIGDAAHSSRTSDHNPNSRGSVNASDIDEIGIDSWALVNLLIKDTRVYYVIYEGQIWQRKHGFKPRKYTGLNAHKRHIHVSIIQAKSIEDSTRPWNVKSILKGAGSVPKPPVKPTLSLSILQKVALTDKNNPKGSTTNWAYVSQVQRALNMRYRNLNVPITGKWDKDTVRGYRAHQLSLKFTGADADGYPGMTSLNVLAYSTKLFNVSK